MPNLPWKRAGNYIFIGGGFGSDFEYSISKIGNGKIIGAVRVYQKTFTAYYTAEFGTQRPWRRKGEPFRTGAQTVQGALEAVAKTLDKEKR